MKKKVTAVIVAAGSGTRMGGAINKVFLPLGGRTVIDYTIEAVSKSELIDNIILVTRECDVLECMEHITNTNKHITIVKGGKTRQESVFMGLKQAEDAEIAVIHDGARALILPETIDEAIKTASEHHAAAAGVQCKDTMKLADENGFIKETLDREKIYQIQTPQVFDYLQIKKAHEMAAKDGFSATDDCALYEKYIGKIKIVQGSYDNIKLTTPEDMEIAENILKKRKDR